MKENKPAQELLSAYKQVQRFAPVATAQPTDDLWAEIERLNQMRDKHEGEKKIVSPRSAKGA